MNRRRFLTLASVVCVATGVLASGCGGGGSGGGTSRIRALPLTGAVSGRLGQRSDGSFVLSYGAFPSGVSAVVGATVEAAGLSPVTTGADGTFTLTEVFHKTATLTVRAPGKPALSVPITIVPDATITVGTPPVSREQALTTAKAALASKLTVATAQLYQPQQPLPTGTVVASPLPTENGLPLNLRALTQPAWLVYADPTPAARFGHTVYWVLVDAQSGATTLLTDFFWPTLNHQSFYSAPAASDPDLVQPGAGRSLPIDTRTSTPPLLPNLSALPTNCTSRAKKQGKSYALVVQGDPRADFAADFARFPQQAFGNAVFPPAALIDRQNTSSLPWELTEFPQITTFDDAHAAMTSNLIQWLQGRINLLFEKASAIDTVVLYFSAHGTVPLKNNVYWVVCTVKDIRWNRVKTANDAYYTGSSDVFHIGVPFEKLDFSGCKACRLVVILDTCYSNVVVNPLASKLQALTGKEVVVLTASDRESWEFEQPQVHQGHSYPAGGVFTTGLLEGLALPLAQETFYERIGGAFAQADATTQLYKLYGPQQHPRLWLRTLDPDESCGEGTQNVKIQ